MKNTIRIPLTTPQGYFLVDSDHESGKVLAMRVHPVLEGIVGTAIDIEGMSGFEELKGKIQEVVKSI